MSDPAGIVAVGAGRMGRGIALAFALAGHRIALVDLKPRSNDERARIEADARAEIAASAAMLAELGALPADVIDEVSARVELFDAARADAALRNAAIVFEAVPETLAAKEEALRRVCAVVPRDAVIASTTSTILVTDLLPLVTFPQRLLNAHWLNPAYAIPLVELSAHPGTAPAVIERLRSLLESIGKVTVLCGPAPGYIVPRLQALIMNEAARMIEAGIASAEEIDRATRYGLGLRFAAIGVVEFIDYGGNDTLYHAGRYLAGQVDAARYAPPPIVERLMREGRIGLKSGQGFYDYRTRDVAAYRKDVLARTLAMLRHVGLQRACIDFTKAQSPQKEGAAP